jgi:N-acetylglucosamine-6-phosphate deacetylase
MVRLFLVSKRIIYLSFKKFCCLGIHIEGPFIDENKRGAHRTDFLRKSPHGIEDLLSCYGSFDNVEIVTVAPEIPNMIENVIPELVNKYNLIVSIGHSVASLDYGERAVCAGARFITHLFNAMLPFHHRDPGLVGMRKKKKERNFF